MKTKSVEEMTRAFQDIPKDRSPKNLHNDHGKRYYNVHYEELMVKYGNNYYSTFSQMKAAVAELIIHTLKEKSFKYSNLYKTREYIDILS